jgi:hypothetical protein
LGAPNGRVQAESVDVGVPGLARRRLAWHGASPGCTAGSTRSGSGGDNTPCRTGTSGMRWPARCAAVFDIMRPLHDGQNPRRLQLKAGSLSWPHSPQRSLAKP